MTALLNVKNLSTCIRGEHETFTVVDDICLDIQAGETVGLVGESGSGKSMTALSISGLLPQPDSFIATGQLLFEGRDMRHLASAEMAKLRGNRIGMIFQDPMTALNPVHRIGKQIAEVLLIHKRYAANSDALNAKVLELLRAVGIPQAELRRDSYPHELSGGMRQRVMIAIALACEPALLIADEPTTALDVTVQAQILQLIKSLQAEYGMALLFITHDLALVSQISDRIAVMYAGQIVETAPTHTLFSQARHPYTRALLASTPGAQVAHKTALPTIAGAVARPQDYGSSCRFRNRCRHAEQACASSSIALETDEGGHSVRCVRWQDAMIEAGHE